MYEESPGRQASIDRALGYWTDKRNFENPTVKKRARGKIINKWKNQVAIQIFAAKSFWGIR